MFNIEHVKKIFIYWVTVILHKVKTAVIYQIASKAETVDIVNQLVGFMERLISVDVSGCSVKNDGPIHIMHPLEYGNGGRLDASSPMGYKGLK